MHLKLSLQNLHKPFSRLFDPPVYFRLDARLAVVDLSMVAERSTVAERSIVADRSRVADADMDDES